VPLKSAIGQWSIVIGPRVRPARSAGTVVLRAGIARIH